MSFIYEDTGTISVANGSTAVVGAGTAWAANYSGIALNIDGLSYPVASVDSVNSLTLAKPYPGTTGVGVEYQFMPLQPENYQLALSVKSVLDLAGTLGSGGIGGTGTNGTNGSVILAGVATPTASLGNDGDYYLNEATYTLYGPKASGAWPTTGLLLKGPQGDPGATGTNGNTIISGSGAPSNTEGNNGDFYLDVSTYWLYGPKASGSWPISGTSLVGPAGSSGGGSGSSATWDFNPPLATNFATKQGQGTSSIADDADVGMIVVSPRDGTREGADGHICYVQPLPNKGGDWTVTAKIKSSQPNNSYGGGNNPAFYGLVLTNTAGTAVMDWGWDMRNVVYKGYFGLPNGFAGSEVQIGWAGAQPEWYRIVHNAAAATLSYQVSADGKTWGEIVSVADTEGFGAIPDNIGFGARMNNGSGLGDYPISFSVPYFRVA